MKIIKTSLSEHILVDNSDYEWLNQYTWFLNNGYAFNKKMGYMHRLIVKPPAGYVVDHRNGVRHDNQRSNLRVANRSQNAANSMPKNPIHWSRRCWRTKIVKDGKTYWKYSMDIQKLIEWREQKAKELYGEYAYQVK